MQFRFAAAAVLGFVASAFAQAADFDSVSIASSVNAGESVVINWSVIDAAKYAGETVAISLIGGATQNTQVPLQTIATGVSNDALTYTWSVPSDLGDDAFYGLVFTLESDTSVFQYSNPFSIVKSTVVETTATTDATATVTSGSGVKTISLSSQPAYTQPAGYTTVVPVYETTTVPCVNSTTPAPYVPPQQHTTVVYEVPSNQTWSTAVVPVVSTTEGSYPVATTPAATVPASAGVRFGASSIAIVGGLMVAVLAL